MTRRPRLAIAAAAALSAAALAVAAVLLGGTGSASALPAHDGHGAAAQAAAGLPASGHPASGHPTGGHPPGGPGHYPAGVIRDLAALRKATDQFHSLDRAQAAGYAMFTDAAGIACIDMPDMGGMGVHFVKGAEVGDPAERLRRPEALVYRIDENGRLRLAAVEYVVLAADWNATHSAPPRLFGQQFALNTAPNRFGLPDFYSLHVWAWYDNPAGRFAPFNPRVTC